MPLGRGGHDGLVMDYDAVREALEAGRLDGWLLFDFHGINPVVRRLSGFRGMVTRRVFVLFPAVGDPHALVHNIDRHAFRNFNGTVETYTRWPELHQRLGAMVRGRRLAMEVSPDDAVPYVDRVPAGITELVSRLGATILPSAPLVTRFAAGWSTDEVVQHRAVAESLAAIARGTLARVVGEVGRATEVGVQRDVIAQMERAEWTVEDPPIVAFGPHAADPHFEPGAGGDATLEADRVVLLDLWARHGPEGMWADQTWMAFSGRTVPSEVRDVWDAVRGARDAVVARLRKGWTGLSGADLDGVARGLLGERGYGEHFVHRTGHSIDYELHGSGPNLDDFETHDVRELLPGIGFSVEPGVYLPGRFGVRSEINVHLGESEAEVTPIEPQTELIVPA
jgi:Xaa-Pro dipeptidase